MLIIQVTIAYIGSEWGENCKIQGELAFRLIRYQNVTGFDDFLMPAMAIYDVA